MTRIFSERSLEGYLEIDHTDSPGISPEQAAKVGSKLVVPGGTKLQAVTRKCNHCQTQVILNPGRIRDRERCWQCWGYLCDRCALMLKLDGQCREFWRRADELLRKLSRAA